MTLKRLSNIKRAFLGISVCAISVLPLNAQHAKPIGFDIVNTPDTALSYRGIAALNDSVIWASGSLGTVTKTLNGGNTWASFIIQNSEELQFRDIHLFDAETAIIMGSGWPTRIFKTANGGSDWRLVYENNDSAIFLNAFDFWPDGSGLCFGDPVDERFFMLKTNDAGEHWERFEGPIANQYEAGFAASGTSLVCGGDSVVWFATGGSASRIFYSDCRGKYWDWQPSQLMFGKPGQGVFGIAANQGNVLLVGGDYQNDASTHKTFALINREADEIKVEKVLPYQSAAVFIDDSTAISVGTPGCHVSYDGGLTWEKFAEFPFHTITKARNGSAVFAAGPKGRIAKVVFKQ